MSRSTGPYGLIGFSGMLVAAWSVHWLITPTQHPNASTAQYLSIWLQIMAGLGVLVWARRKDKHENATSRAPSSP